MSTPTETLVHLFDGGADTYENGVLVDAKRWTPDYIKQMRASTAPAPGEETFGEVGDYGGIQIIRGPTVTFSPSWFTSKPKVGIGTKPPQARHQRIRA